MYWRSLLKASLLSWRPRRRLRCPSVPLLTHPLDLLFCSFAFELSANIFGLDIYNNIVCSPLVHLNFSKFQFCEFLEREYSSKLFWLLSTSPTLISFKYLFYSENISVSLPLLPTTILFASLLNLPYVYIIFCINSFPQKLSIGFRILLIIINYIIKIYLLLTWSLLLRRSDIL